MIRPNPLPEAFLDDLRQVEASSIERSDPIEQSGFDGGSERWRAEREPNFVITMAGELLDLGCADGSPLALQPRVHESKSVALR